MTSTRWTAIGTGLFCPLALSREPNQVTLFTRSATGELLCQEWKDNSWNESYSLGIPVAQNSGPGEQIPIDWQLSGCADESKRIDLFARSPEGALLHGTSTAATGCAFEHLGAPAKMRNGIAFPMGLAGPPAVCSNSSQRLDIFAIGQGGELLHTARIGEHWSEFESLGVPTMYIAGTRAQPVPVSSTLAACCCGNNRMAVFIRAATGPLLLKWWDGSEWSQFASLGMPNLPDETYPAVTAPAPLTGAPAACSWGPGRMDVFIRGPAGSLLHKWWTGREWSSFESLGMPATQKAETRPIPFAGAVAACSWGPNRLDVFARALDGNLYHAWWDGHWNHD